MQKISSEPAHIFVFRLIPSGGLHPVILSATSLDETSYQLPQGVYTTFRTYGNRQLVVGLKKHLQRLVNSAQGLGYYGGIDSTGLRIALRDILHNHINDFEVRVRITLDLTKDPGVVYISIQSLQPYPMEIYTTGIQVQTSTLHRPEPEIKSTQFLRTTQQQRSAMPEGVFELLLLDEWGHILEGMTSNFFAVREGTIFTAREGVLEGVTRQVVLDVAAQNRIPILFQPVVFHDLGAMSEAFITSSSRGIVPVVKINDLPIGNGKPGPVTQKFGDLYTQAIEKMAEEI